MKKQKRSLVDYMWVLSSLYLFLGMFNILFAWLGMLCFLIPIIMSVMSGEKSYCNKYCGRGQLFAVLGTTCKLSRNKPIPKFLKTKWFRYGFLAFFMTMFLNMIFNTYLVFVGTQNVSEVITLLWTFKLPWNVTDITSVAPWIAQYAYGFFSVMVTSTVLGVITMVLFKPRSWCVYCPMGTMTQGICQLKHELSKGRE